MLCVPGLDGFPCLQDLLLSVGLPTLACSLRIKDCFCVFCISVSVCHPRDESQRPRTQVCSLSLHHPANAASLSHDFSVLCSSVVLVSCPVRTAARHSVFTECVCVLWMKKAPVWGEEGHYGLFLEASFTFPSFTRDHEASWLEILNE